jgi:hypothetical protein
LYQPETKTKTPGECLSALTDAAKGFQQVGKFIDATSGVPDMILAAAQAGENVDADAMRQVHEDLDTATGKMAKVNDTVTGIVQDFNTHKAICRSSASD